MGNAQSSIKHNLYITKIVNPDLPLVPFLHTIVSVGSLNISNVEPSIFKKIMQEKDLILGIKNIVTQEYFYVTIPMGTQKLGINVAKLQKIPEILKMRVLEITESAQTPLQVGDNILGIEGQYIQEEDELIFNVRSNKSILRLIVLRHGQVKILEITSDSLGCEIGIGILYKIVGSEFQMEDYNGNIRTSLISGMEELGLEKNGTGVRPVANQADGFSIDPMPIQANNGTVVGAVASQAAGASQDETPTPGDDTITSMDVAITHLDAAGQMTKSKVPIVSQEDSQKPISILTSENGTTGVSDLTKGVSDLTMSTPSVDANTAVSATPSHLPQVPDHPVMVNNSNYPIHSAAARDTASSSNRGLSNYEGFHSEKKHFIGKQDGSKETVNPVGNNLVCEEDYTTVNGETRVKDDVYADKQNIIKDLFNESQESEGDFKLSSK